MKPGIFYKAVALTAICGAALTTQAFMKTDRNKKRDEQGHILTSLWKEYYAAEKADQPLGMLSALDGIKEKAKAKRYHWDFYDASVKKVDVGSSRDWKKRSSLQAELSKDIEEYDEPIVNYTFRKSRNERGLTDYVLVNRARLQAGDNEVFHTWTSGQMNGLLNSFIKDDYEYALWAEYIDGWNASKASAALKDCLGDSYPASAWVEYLSINRGDWSKRKDRAEAFAAKYQGRAIGLFGKSIVFSQRMSELERENAGEDEFKALYSGIKAAEKERKSYKSGVDAKIAGTIEDFKRQMESLERGGLTVTLKDSVIVLEMRNLDKADVTMVSDSKEAATIIKETVMNPRQRFHVVDTVMIPIPKCDDGDYLVTAKGGGLIDEARYSKKTLSIAMREDSEGWKFYVADYITGEPCAKVDLTLSLSGKVVAEAKDVRIDGFTPLPETISKALDTRATYYLTASCGDGGGTLRKSKDESLRPYNSYYSGARSASTYCNIFTDKSAYNPGETVKFKAVIYEGDMTRSLHTIDAGTQVVATLFNAERKEAGNLKLTTNDFGSVAGEFALPEGERNGTFRLEISCGRASESKSLVVDEFVLPTYDLKFESVDSLYFMGDDLEVRGRLVSYSGHPLDAAEVTFDVDSRGSRMLSGPVEVASDGTFAVRFPSVEGSYWYRVTLKVKDATGETKEFSRGVYVLNYFNIGLSLENAASGDFRLSYDSYGPAGAILSEDKAEMSFVVRNSEGQVVPAPVSYELKDEGGKVIASGDAMSGDKKSLNIPRSGKYTLSASSSVKSSKGREVSSREEYVILRVGDSDKVLNAKVENLFKLVGPCADGSLKDGEEVKLQIGAGDGPVWAVVELFGDKRQPLGRHLVHLDGKAGESGSLTTVAFGYQQNYPDAIFLTVFYFRKGDDFTFSREFRREKEELELPLAFASFEDKALPGKEYSFTLKSEPGVEAVAAVFDKSSETISPNLWHTVRLIDVGAMSVYYQTQNGSISGYRIGDRAVLGAGLDGRMYKTRSAGMVEEVGINAAAVPEPMMAEMAVADEAAFDDLVEEADEVAVRSDFSTALAFEPFLRTGKDGTATLKFRTSDKLSTFVVQVYAHTPDMKNALVRREMTVSVPVKLSVVQPGYLYKGDKYVLHAVVSSVTDAPVSGNVTLQVYPSATYEGVKPYSVSSKKVTIPAGGSVPVEFEVNPGNHDALGLKVVFADKGKTFSDGVFVSVPVHEAAQTLTEAHSAVLLSGVDKNEVLRRLQGEFTGTTYKGAEYREIDIRRMILDAIPSKVEPKGRDVLSLTEAFYVRSVAARLGASVETSMPDEELYSKIVSCRNSDGGFGWFEGMKSSPVITAVVLERFAKLKALPAPAVPELVEGVEGLSLAEGRSLSLAEGFDPSSSVVYLDRNQFIHGGSWPYWCGWLSLAQYAHVRSMYASVPFSVQTDTPGDKSEYSKNFKEFKKEVADYLVPSGKDGRGLQGQILSKARRIKTLLNLVDSEDGLALASAWGIKFGAESKIKGSYEADIESLRQYAVEHRDGGWYYPNAVMPWRGLLESELYAHSMLCDLLSAVPEKAEGPGSAEGPSLSTIAGGIRLWIMLQKETQKWADDPAFVDAINSVLSGGEDVLSTKVILLEKTYRKPFPEIVSAGNGFTIERRFFKEVRGADGAIGRMEIYPGVILKVGDKVTAEYQIWNQENRSFVKLAAPREAAFRPVNQLSGHYGWWMRPIGGRYSLTPQGYRDVKTDRTEYYFDAYPEENTTVAEEFFITQEGVFTAPVVTIESLYAPHYRANDKFGGQLKVDE